MQDTQQEPIAIIGMGCRFAKANNPQEFWNLLRTGEDAIREVPADRWNIEKLYDPDSTVPGKMMSRWGGFIDQIDQFDWQTFRLLPREAKYIDPQQRLLLEVAWESLEDAGLPLKDIAGSKTSVFVGIGWSDYLRLQSRNWSQLDEYTMMGSASSFASNRLSYTFDLKGPSVSVDTGCTSSLTAIYLACQSLWTGEAKLALAGGVNLIVSPDSTIMLSKSGLLSPEGRCKTLDAHADGIVRGEGAGMVILKPLSQVQPSDRVYALIRGMALSHNGHNEWIIASSQSAQELLLRDAYHHAGINPSDVDYVELHGTGFLRGDAIETRALGNILGSSPERTHPCQIGSVKTNIGHLETASGIASVIKVALSLYHQEIPPTLHLQTLNPDIPLDDLHLAAPQTCMPWPAKESTAIAGINTLAYAGSNAHAVLSAYSPIAHTLVPAYDHVIKPTHHLLTLSARTAQSLQYQVEAYHDFLLDQNTTYSWQDICYSANVRRSHYSHRFAVLSCTSQTAADALNTYLQEQSSSGAKSKALQKGLDKPLFLFSHHLSTKYDTHYANLQREPAFRTTIEACDQILQTLSEKPLLVKSSDTATLVFDSNIQSKIMHFVMQVSLATLLQSWGILPGAVLGEGSGEVAAAYISGALSLKDALQIISSQPEHMVTLLQHIQLLPTNVPLYSTSVGLMSADPCPAISHWHEQLVHPQPLPNIVTSLLSNNDDIYLEIGYPSALRSTVLACSQEQTQAKTVLASLHHEKEAHSSLLEIVKALYSRGYDINWSTIYHDEEYHCVSLPLYSWQRERLWPAWLDLEEISTPPETRHANTQNSKYVSQVEIAGQSVEQVLTDIWIEILELEQITSDSNFFALGGHSLLAMQLLGRIRTTFQVEVSLEELLQSPTPSGCAKMIEEKYTSQPDASRISSPLPAIEPDWQARHHPFPLTDVQYAYWVGRNSAFEIGGVGNHGYIEVEATDLDLTRFQNALQRLLERHEMLRAVMLADGQQRIREQVPLFPLAIIDLRALNQPGQSLHLEQIRRSLDHQVFSLEQWPPFALYLSRLDDHLVRLHLSIESLFVDAWSMNVLIQEFVRFYHEPELSLPVPTLSFRDYVLAETASHTSESYQQAQEYWLQRLPALPPAPDLPLATDTGLKKQPRFVHHEGRLSAEHWQRLKDHAAQLGLTPSGILLTAFAEILAAWSRAPHFSINLSTFNRWPFHPDVNEIVGDFTSLLPLEIDHRAPDTFANRAQRLQKQLWNDLDHSAYSGIQVLRELMKAQGTIRKAVMPIVFTSLLIQDIATSSPPPWGKTLYCVSQTPQVWLDHQVLEVNGELVFHWQSVDAIFPAGLIDAMFDAYAQLLERLTAHDEAWSEPLRDLLPEQQRALVAQVNTTQAPVSEKLLHTLFIDQVAQRPDQLAVISSNRLLSYQEVYRGALQLAHQLRQWGVRKNQLVGIVLEKGWEQVVAVLGVLQSGAAYLPIDPQLPAERFHYLLQHGEVEVVLTQSWLTKTITWPDSLKRIYVDGLDLEQEDLPEVVSLQSPEDLAYVIYTSGSTGMPKGVMIDHRGAVNTVLEINERFQVQSTDRVLALSALNFDLSVYDIFGLLAAGGTIVLPSPNDVRDPASWLRLVQQEGVTIWNTVPALLQLLVEYAELQPQALQATHLRVALLSGDWIPLTLPERITNVCAPIEVISLGGATEASIWSICYPIEKLDPSWKSIPYGRPLRNQQFFVLNEDFEVCPVWVPGDLYIAGTGLALGYWRDPEKTRASFFAHPRTGLPLYRTGDRGRYFPDGTIEFLGRQDLQVKVQGYRIELGEIEAALSRHPWVQEAVATVLGGIDEGKRIVASLVPRAQQSLKSSDLHQFLAEHLPEYMIPTRFFLFDALPLSTNGKVDRQALQAQIQLQTTPEVPTERAQREQKPETLFSPVALQVIQIIADVLQVTHVDPTLSLLECGATSLDILRIANQLEIRLHIHPEFTLLFTANINAIVAYCEKKLSVDAVAVSTSELKHVSDAFNLIDASEEREKLEKKRYDIKQMDHISSAIQLHTGAIAAGTSKAKGIPDSFNLILEPEEREQFKKEKHGLRQVNHVSSAIQLHMPKIEDKMLQKYTERRSYRSFLPQPIPFRLFSEFLTSLWQASLDGEPKYQWGSAGGLYPIQAYLYIRPGGVEDVDPGAYYYHPIKHHLSLITPDAQLDPKIFGLSNQEIFDQAAFAIFLIGQLGAIGPMYGELSRDFCLLEAGAMTQLLESSAPSYQIGLCQIGGVNFPKIQHAFALDKECIYLHSLCGGKLNVHRQQEAQRLQAVNAASDDWEVGSI